MNATTEYFREKRPWSIFKDALLECYLPPYIAKLAQKGQDIYLIDCFAGKGKFDDGNVGSPFIIINAIKKALQRRPKSQIKPIFIEQKYAPELKKNLSDYPHCKVVDGKFEDQFERFKRICKHATVLLYIDPYGIKSLDSLFFKELLDISERAGTSFEVLLNLNAFGFLREGCRLIKPSIMGEFDDNDAIYEGKIESKEKMDRIAGGNFWEKQIIDYYSGAITFSQLENSFTRSYLNHMGIEMGWNGFSYVLETPIKDKIVNIPKYRMIFGTNHVDGALLMADNMSRRWKEFLNHDRAGQGLLFEILATTEGKEFIWEDVDNVIIALVQRNKRVNIKNALVEVWGNFGISISEKEIKRRIWYLYNQRGIDIIWDPPTTRMAQKPRSLDYKRYNIELIK